MGDMNQLNFVKANVGLVHQPVLEVGSKDYGNTPDFRSLLPNRRRYVGIDMEDGKGVDLVLDLTDDFDTISGKLGGGRFKTVICFSVLEHCFDPFKLCSNITRLLDNGGILFISVPFSWRIHGYPSDFWRFTPDGIKCLFPELLFDIQEGNLSTCKIGETGPINDYMFRAEVDISKGRERKVYGHFDAALIRVCRRFRILPWIFDYPYLFPPVMVNMIGKKK